MIRGIHHVAIHTKNFDELVNFYKVAFGFHAVSDIMQWEGNEIIDSLIDVQGSAARQIMLKAGNAYLEVFEYSAPEGRTDAPLRPHDVGYTHFAVDTDDIEADYKRLLEAGMTFPRTVPDSLGGIRAVYGKDPFGNIIELQQVATEHDFAFEKLRGQDSGNVR